MKRSQWAYCISVLCCIETQTSALKEKKTVVKVLARYNIRLVDNSVYKFEINQFWCK